MADQNQSTKKEERPRVSIPKRVLIPILVTMSLQFAGSMTISDFPQLFEGKLIEDLNLTTQSVQAMYSVTGIVGLVLDPFIGYVIQSIGFGYSCIIFQFFSLLGIVATGFAIAYSSFFMLVVSRVVIGVGMDSLWVWQAPACEKWFSSGSYMTMAMAINRIVATLITSLTTYVMPIIYVSSGKLTLTVVFPGVICLVCFIGSILFMLLETKHEKLLEIQGLEDVEKSKQAGRSRARYAHLLKIRPITYAIILAIFFYPMMLRQFTNTMTDFITVKHGIDFIQAKNLSAFLQITRAPFLMIFSTLVTRYGKRSLGLILSPLMHLIGQVIFLLLPTDGQTPIWVLYLTVLFVALGDGLYGARHGPAS